MCEVGVWKNFNELEESLTLDELFTLYEATSERQKRIMKSLSAAMGGDVSEGGTDLQATGSSVSDGLFGYQEAGSGE